MNSGAGADHIPDACSVYNAQRAVHKRVHRSRGGIWMLGLEVRKAFSAVDGDGQMRAVVEDDVQAIPKHVTQIKLL